MEKKMYEHAREKIEEVKFSKTKLSLVMRIRSLEKNNNNFVENEIV